MAPPAFPAPGDYEHTDIVVGINTSAAGKFLNVRKFIVQPGVTLGVVQYDGSLLGTDNLPTSNTGALVVEAEEVTVYGTVDARGAGYGGGGGGGGGGGSSSPGSSEYGSGGAAGLAGAVANNGGQGDSGAFSIQLPLRLGNSAGGSGGAGGGPYGAPGGLGGTSGMGGGSAGAGPYLQDETTFMGSGGGGGAGGYGATAVPNAGPHAYSGGGGGGGAGWRGGGVIRFIASVQINIFGSVLTGGKASESGHNAGETGNAHGQNGGRGGNGNVDGGSAGGIGNTYNLYTGGTGHTGGGGAGGTVLLKFRSRGSQITAGPRVGITGTVDAREWLIPLYGGTVKIFTPSYSLTGAINTRTEGPYRPYVLPFGTMAG